VFITVDNLIIDLPGHLRFGSSLDRNSIVDAVSSTDNHVLHCRCVNFRFDISCFCSDGIRWISWFSSTSLIDSNNSEYILFAFSETSYGTLRLWSRALSCSFPESKLALLLNDPHLDGTTAITARWIPLQVNSINIPIISKWFSWSSRKLKWIPGSYWLLGSNKRLSFTLSIDSSDSVEIFMLFNQTVNSHRELSGFTTWHPSHIFLVLFLNNVMFDLTASVILWYSPVDDHVILSNFFRINWSFWRPRNIQDCYITSHCVSTILVLGNKFVNTGVGSFAFSDSNCGSVVFIDD